MKIRYLALILAPLFSTAALAASYTGPGAQSVTTVAAANDAADDTPVVLQGYVTKKINNDDKYEFKDNTGTITVEIDDVDLPPTPFNDKTKVKLTGATGFAGIAFDVYDDDDFKFVGVDEAGALAGLVARRRMAENELASFRDQIAKYESSARTALGQGKTDLAREVAVRISELEVEISTRGPLIEDMKTAETRLRTAIASTDQKIETLRREIDIVKVNDSVQKAQTSVALNSAGAQSRIGSAADSLQRIKQRQAVQEERLRVGQRHAHALLGFGQLVGALAHAALQLGIEAADLVLLLVQFGDVARDRQQHHRLAAGVANRRDHGVPPLGRSLERRAIGHEPCTLPAPGRGDRGRKGLARHAYVLGLSRWRPVCRRS